MRIPNRKELAMMREQYRASLNSQRKQILICAGTGCVAGGSLKIYDRMQEIMKEKGLEVSLVLEKEPHETVGIKKSGCHGFCEMGPLVRIEPMGWLYLKVSVSDCEEIIEKSIIHDEVIDRLVYKDKERKPYVKQEEISEASLRGRGGGGFPTGKKWAQVLRQDSPEKYVVCNGDEGDPGAFMDRSMMEGEPHRVIEGMIIAGIATGAHYGYIYVRAEYPLAVERLTTAIAKAEEKGLLGKNILDSGFDFELKICQGAGAFVCGEGSALTASIEGNRGMPRVKPPRTVEKGKKRI